MLRLIGTPLFSPTNTFGPINLLFSILNRGKVLILLFFFRATKKNSQFRKMKSKRLACIHEKSILICTVRFDAFFKLFNSVFLFLSDDGNMGQERQVAQLNEVHRCRSKRLGWLLFCRWLLGTQVTVSHCDTDPLGNRVHGRDMENLQSCI